MYISSLLRIDECQKKVIHKVMGIRIKCKDYLQTLLSFVVQIVGG